MPTNKQQSEEGVLGYTLRNPEGKYLNTDYHSSLRKGDWREQRVQARIYKSKQGIRQAIGSKSSILNLFEKHGVPRSIYCLNPYGYEAWANYRKQTELVRQVSLEDFFTTLHEHGYTLEVIR